MQILCDTDTETLAGLLSIIRTLNEVMYARSADVPTGTNAVPQLPPAAPAAPATAPSVLAAAIAIAGVESANSGDAPPAGLGFGEPSVTSIQIANGNGTVDNSAPPALLTTQSIASPATIVPAAPSASVPAAAPPAALTPNSLTVALAAELDSAGLPWDARIHSDTHKKNADGSWRFRRNLDEAVKVAVLAEMRGVAAVPLAPPAAAGSAASVVVPPASLMTTAPVSIAVNSVPPIQTTMTDLGATIHIQPARIMVPLPPTGANVAGSGGATGANVVPQPPVTPPAVPVPPAAPVGVPDAAKPVLLSDLIAKINKGFGAKTLTMVEVTAACEAEGLAGITALGHHPGKVQAVIDRLKL